MKALSGVGFILIALPCLASGPYQTDFNRVVCSSYRVSSAIKKNVAASRKEFLAYEGKDFFTKPHYKKMTKLDDGTVNELMEMLVQYGMINDGVHVLQTALALSALCPKADPGKWKTTCDDFNKIKNNVTQFTAYVGDQQQWMDNNPGVQKNISVAEQNYRAAMEDKSHVKRDLRNPNLGDDERALVTVELAVAKYLQTEDKNSLQTAHQACADRKVVPFDAATIDEEFGLSTTDISRKDGARGPSKN